jgi:molecular chaperone DnaK (HSP70)
MDITLVKRELEKAVQEINNKKLEKDDGFVKFLSESRDWAYEYISTTQSVIDKFNLDVNEILESDNKPTQKLSQVKKACDELKKILPEEDKNIKEKQ